MEQSILKSTKKILGVSLEDDSFDLDILTHINTAFSTLNDTGVGPTEGFVIDDEEPTWIEFLPEDPIMLAKVKTYVYLRVRLIFDPPATSYVLDAMQKQLTEVEWRLNVNRENKDWVDPDPDRSYATLREPVDTHFAEG